MDRVTGTTWKNAQNTIVADYRYEYNAAGMITRKQSTINSAQSVETYAYDSFDRLTGETRADAVSGAYAKIYGYDLVWNRLQKTENGVSTVYTVGQGNRLASFGTDGSVGYNAAGCVTALVYSVGNRRDLTWNSQYQLTQASVNGAVAETYSYDAMGRRVRVVSGGVTENYLYNGLDVVADVDVAGTLIRSYVHGPGIDNILAMTVHAGTPRTYYYLKDHLGSVHAVVDSTGSVVESYKYDAWGNVLEVRNGSGNLLTQSAIGNRYLWQGREYSWATKLYYFRARWMDPVTGRWLSNDPIGISGGLNMYYFCADDPVNFVDPLGLYGTDTHYTRTRQWGRKEGISRGDSTLIANADEETDYGATAPVAPENVLRTENEHFQQFPGHERREDIYRRATDAAESGDAAAFGRALHEFQDTYSHEGFRPFPGHAGHSEVDIFNPNSVRDMRMERRTRELLRHWKHKERNLGDK